jgi:aryl-alcohol dehydrogenase-like predicted oxidoreductase
MCTSKEKEQQGTKFSRRNFVKRMTMGVTGIAMMVKQLSCTSFKTVKKIPRRRLGRTNLMVSEISMGGHFKGTDWHSKWETISPEIKELRDTIFKESIKYGINFFDTNYEFERKLLALSLKNNPGIREKIIVVADVNDYFADTPDQIYDTMMTQIDIQLNNLGLPYTDVLRFSAVNKRTHPKRLEFMIKAFKEIKKAGKAKYLAISHHVPEVLLKWINAFDEIDIIYMVYNYFASLAEKELFPVAKKKDIGIVTIKPFNKGTIFGSTGEEAPMEWSFVRAMVDSLKDVEKDLTTEDLIQGRNISLAQASLRYVLSNKDISTVLIGVDNMEQFNENISIAGNTKFGKSDRSLLDQYVSRFEEELPDNYKWLKTWKYS